MNVEKYKIYRVVKNDHFNEWHERIFKAGDTVQVVEYNSSLPFAKLIGSDKTPRWIGDDNLRHLTEFEKGVLEGKHNLEAEKNE